LIIIAVSWRGPHVMGIILQFFVNVIWGI